MKKSIICFSIFLFAFGSASAAVQSYYASPSEISAIDQKLDTKAGFSTAQSIYTNSSMEDESLYSTNDNNNSSFDTYSNKYYLHDTASLPQVPEPATVVLFALGLVGGFARKKFKQHK